MEKHVPFGTEPEHDCSCVWLLTVPIGSVACTVIWTEFLALASTAAAAVIVTAPDAVGAMKTPVESIDPALVLQETPWLDVPLTVAEN